MDCLESRFAPTSNGTVLGFGIVIITVVGGLHKYAEAHALVSRFRPHDSGWVAWIAKGGLLLHRTVRTR